MIGGLLRRASSRGFLRRQVYRLGFPFGRWIVLPIVNAILVRRRRADVVPGSVLHISWMVHVPWHTTRILRKQGVNADYLAVGPKSPVWSQFDHHFDPDPPSLLRELRFFWRVVARYEIVHLHFALSSTRSGWDLPVLERLGTKIVVHFRGCEARDEATNRALHPDMNICQECDYGGRMCRESRPRVRRARRYGDLFLATTPDLKDFVPEAIHFPFFSPDDSELVPLPRAPGKPFKIVHVTNHPGIEGTVHLERAVDALRKQGHRIDLVHLSGVSHSRVLEELAGADLTVGKLKMGYYANAQIESLAAGVPAVTYLRPEFVTPEMADSGLILTDLAALESTLEHYLTHPEALERKRLLAKDTARRLHDNARLATKLADMYRKLLEERT